MTMTRARVRVVLISAWVATILLLIYLAGVPMWLAFIGNVAGGAVIYNYAPTLPEEPLSRGDRALRIGAYVLLTTVAACFALVTMLAFLVAWLAN